MINISQLFSDEDNYILAINFTYPNDEVEYFYDIDFNPRNCTFEKSEYSLWSDNDYLRNHPELPGVESYLEKWTADNQENILSWVIENSPWFSKSITDEKHFFISHCGYSYSGRELKKLFTHPFLIERFKSNYVKTLLYTESSSQAVVKNFDDTLSLLSDTDVFIGENDASFFHRMCFSGFRTLSRKDGGSMIIDFNTKEIDICM